MSGYTITSTFLRKFFSKNVDFGLWGKQCSFPKLHIFFAFYLTMLPPKKLSKTLPFLAVEVVVMELGLLSQVLELAAE